MIKAGKRVSLAELAKRSSDRVDVFLEQQKNKYEPRILELEDNISSMRMKENNNVYEVNGDDIGNRIGKWAMNNKGKRKVIIDR